MKRATLLLAAMLAALLLASGAALAAPKSVDPDTLTPPPPPGAECKDTGKYVICKTFLDEPAVNEPFAELPCGTVYITASDHREGIRWYADGLLVKRFVRQDAEGTLSLSPTGEGPTVRFFAHANWQTVYPIPGDESSEMLTFHGNDTRVVVPGSGGIHIAGITYPDDTHHGVIRTENDPEVAAALCEALEPE